MTSILAILIAVIAIFVGYAIWKNSKEQRDRFKDFIDGQEKLAIKTRKEAREEFDKLIAEQQKDMESASTDGKKKIEEIISDLKKEKAAIGVSGVYNIPLASASAFTPFSYGSVDAILHGYQTKNLFCVKCGKEFKYRYSNNPVINRLNGYLAVSQEEHVHCPHCGADNIIQ
jgi:uncharacterized protein YxeA/DNA-directed RNA polymerase subunit RPC12/RpoP